MREAGASTSKRSASSGKLLEAFDSVLRAAKFRHPAYPLEPNAKEPFDRNVSSPEAGRSRWFAEEVQPHGQSLRSYLQGSFPTIHDVDDVVQESFLRVWKSGAHRTIDSARGFLFKIARHLAIDAIRRKRRSPVETVGALEELNVSEDRPAISSTVSRNEKIQLLISAIDSLPPKCRQVVVLRKLKDVPVRQIAEQLGISEKGVEIQLTRGIARCREFLSKRGVRSLFDDEA